MCDDATGNQFVNIIIISVNGSFFFSFNSYPPKNYTCMWLHSHVIDQSKG